MCMTFDTQWKHRWKPHLPWITHQNHTWFSSVFSMDITNTKIKKHSKMKNPLNFFLWRCHLQYHMTLLKTNNNKIPTFWLFLKYILSWEIKALKQYLLITKEVWIVLEAISKTRASCLTGVSRHLETIKALGLRPRAFIGFSVSRNSGQTLALVFGI